MWPDASGAQPAHDPERDAPGAAPDPARTVPLDRRVALAWGRRRHDHWHEHWIRSTEALARLQERHCMADATIDEIDGRDIRIGDRWLTDYASGAYLGLDLDEEIIDAVPRYLARWGTHLSWSRLAGSPVLYEEIEASLAALLGCEDVLTLPSATHVHLAVIPVLAGGGTVFLDDRAHRTVHDGCALATARGATVVRFAHNDLDELAARLREPGRRRPGLICLDGVNAMTGEQADIAAVAALARAHDLRLYVDDAHGVGVLGARAAQEPCPYGIGGSGSIRHAGETYDNVILVGGGSRALSAGLAFVACPSATKRVLKTAAAPYAQSGAASVAALAMTLEGLRVNELRGDGLRTRLYRLTARLRRRIDELQIATPSRSSRSGLPILALPLADAGRIDEVGELLFDRGVYATPVVAPLVPGDEAGFRVRLTAVHTDEHVDHLADVLAELAGHFKVSTQPAE